jgi:zinc transport system permease protein
MTAWYWLTDLLPFAWAHYVFMKHALLAVLLISPLFALLGCHVIHNQMAFFSEAIGHAALTGIAIGVLFGLGNPLWAMVGFSAVLAVAVTLLRRRSAASTDTIIGLVMAFTVALGVVLLSRGGGFAKYSRYLVGDLLTVSAAELGGLAVLLAAVLALWAAVFNALLLASINRPLARSRGVAVWTVEALFATAVAVVVTVSVPWLGLLVINSLIILPAAAARNLARNTPSYVGWAVAISLASGILGLVSSYYWATAAGATIVLYAMGFFALSLAARRR